MGKRKCLPVPKLVIKGFLPYGCFLFRYYTTHTHISFNYAKNMSNNYANNTELILV